MMILRIISVLGLGWLTYAGLQNIYYSEYLSAGVKLGFGLLLVALLTSVWLIRSGQQLTADYDVKRGPWRVLCGSSTLLGLVLGGIFWLIFFIGS